MKLNPEELTANGYELLDELGHLDIIPFVQRYLKMKTYYTVLYIAFNLLGFLMILLYFWLNYRAGEISISDGLMYISIGIGLSFTLIPIHEYIHALAYKLMGAKNTSYDANLKKFYFMAMADKFVASKNEFLFVALAPFTVISLFVLIPVLFVPASAALILLGIFLTHTAFCSGDFGLLSYFNYHKDKEIVTYDDKTNRISYFYGRNK